MTNKAESNFSINILLFNPNKLGKKVVACKENKSSVKPQKIDILRGNKTHSISSVSVPTAIKLQVLIIMQKL